MNGMSLNRHPVRSITDMGYHDFRRQLDYKAKIRVGVVVVADCWFVSSTTCSQYGKNLDNLPLSVRELVCAECGMKHDRDRNAAIDLKNYALSSTVSACGWEGAGSGRKIKTKSIPVKKKVSNIATNK